MNEAKQSTHKGVVQVYKQHVLHALTASSQSFGPLTSISNDLHLSQPWVFIMLFQNGVVRK